MPLETATFISDLAPANPAHGDQVNQADAHMRLIKSALKATFPGFTAAALASSQAQIDAAVTALTTGVLTPAAGTAALPSYTFAGDVDTGFYHSAANEISVATNGAQVAKWTTGGLDLIAANHLLVGGAAVFPLQSANIGALQVLTAAIALNNVTYATMQQATAARLLGNPTGGTANVSEISLGAGLKFTGSVLSAPAVPVRGSYANKTIKVLTNTTAAVVVDSVVVSDGTNYFNVAVNNTLTTNAGVGLDQLDSTTTIAVGQSLFVFAIYNGTTVKTVASASATPDLTNAAFTGYTSWAYLGSLRTAAASTNLMGTWQLGREVSYKLGLAQTTALPVIISGSVANAGWALITPTYTTVSITPFVPTTASLIHITATAQLGAFTAQNLYVAPNTSYNGSESINPPPIAIPNTIGATASARIILEGTTVAWCATAAGAGFICTGWTEMF